MRRGLFGGTFDPPHVGHLMIAEVARETLSLDRMDFVLASVPPHKMHQRVSPVPDRVAMLEAAVQTFSNFAVSLVETLREGPSFTVDTVLEYRSKAPEDDLFLLVGADMLADFPDWKGAAAIVREAGLTVAPRPHISIDGAARELLERLPDARIHPLDMPELEVSSSWIRDRIRKGLRVDPLLPSGVFEVIRQRGIYRDWSD